MSGTALLHPGEVTERQAIEGWPCPQCPAARGEPCRMSRSTPGGGQQWVTLALPHPRRVNLVRYIGPRQKI